MQSTLNFSLNNLMEFDCFIRAFRFLMDTLPEDELFHEPHLQAKKDADVAVTYRDI